MTLSYIVFNKLLSFRFEVQRYWLIGVVIVDAITPMGWILNLRDELERRNEAAQLIR